MTAPAHRRPPCASSLAPVDEISSQCHATHDNNMKSIYDDQEHMLQDQGLEVVVVPYRPSPHAAAANKNEDTYSDALKNTRDNSSTSASTVTSTEEESPVEFMTARPSRQLVTPRSQLAMVEAVCHDGNNGKSLMHPITTASSAAGSSSNNRAEEQRENSTSKRASRSSSSTQTDHSQRTTTTKSASKKHNRKLSYIQLAKLGYQELVHAIIRPPRSLYTLEALGPDSFTFCNVHFTRRDFSVRNNRGMRIQCSLWSCHRWELNDENDDVDNNKEENVHNREGIDRQETEEYRGRFILDDWDESKERGRMYLQLNSELLDDSSEVVNKTTATSNDPNKTNGDNSTKTTKRQRHPIVIYLHGNSSSRLEVIPQLGHLLSLGLSVLSFDFTGSGHSDGEYVSLGYHEREDLDTIITYLRNTRQVSHVALWGRSMGAATALMYASRDPTIACMVLDSPFTDLQRLIEEMVERGRKQGVIVPNLVLNVVMRLIKNSVKSTAGFSLRHISPISHADKCFVPAMFVAGEHDDFIHKSHSILIHRRYPGDKSISIVDGDHNSPRPRFLQQSACLFLQSVMGLPADGELVVPMGMNLLIPPWLLTNPRELMAARGKNDVHSKHRRTTWLPVNEQKEQRKVHHHRSQSEVLEYHQDKGLHRRRQTSPDFNDTRSNQNDEVLAAREGKEASAVLAAANPPDMNERQKNIQSSLFKMLGQSEP